MNKSSKHHANLKNGYIIPHRTPHHTTPQYISHHTIPQYILVIIHIHVLDVTVWIILPFQFFSEQRFEYMRVSVTTIIEYKECETTKIKMRMRS
jgi:hypothetical protein